MSFDEGVLVFGSPLAFLEHILGISPHKPGPARLPGPPLNVEEPL